jgi:hypothetical protein
MYKAALLAEVPLCMLHHHSSMAACMLSVVLLSTAGTGVQALCAAACRRLLFRLQCHRFCIRTDRVWQDPYHGHERRGRWGRRGGAGNHSQSHQVSTACFVMVCLACARQIKRCFVVSRLVDTENKLFVVRSQYRFRFLCMQCRLPPQECVVPPSTLAYGTGLSLENRK